MAADLVEEQLQRVGRRAGERHVVERRRLGFAAAVVAQIDVAGLQLLVDPADVVVLELQGLGELVDLGEIDASRLLTAIEERCDRAVRGFVDHAHHYLLVTASDLA